MCERFLTLPFLSELTIKKYIKKISEIVEKEAKKDDYNPRELLKRIFNPSFEDSIDVLDFWERLLIDSLVFLKWNDLNEFPLEDVDNPEYVRPKNREEAYNKISEGSLFVFKLKEYFKTFIEFERLLYGAEQFYRDHVYHIIRVWLTGEVILHDFIDENFKIHIFDASENMRGDILRRRQGDTITISSKSNGLLYDGEEEAIWCLIALTHDLGYPLSKVEKINNSLRKMMSYFAKTGLEEFSFAFPQQNQFINDAILRYLSSKLVRYERHSIDYKTHIQAKYYLKFSRSFERFDHGIISCLALVKNLMYFMETNFDWDDVAVLNDVEEGGCPFLSLN